PLSHLTSTTSSRQLEVLEIDESRILKASGANRLFPPAACDEAPEMPPAFCLEGGAPRRALPSSRHGALACRLQRLVVPRASDQCFSRVVSQRRPDGMGHGVEGGRQLQHCGRHHVRRFRHDHLD
ncbi:unnamed protein product, partial [Closterium sp. NIES-65]